MKEKIDNITNKNQNNSKFLLNRSLLLLFGAPFSYFAALVLNHVFFPGIIEGTIDFFTLDRLIDFSFFSISPVAVYFFFLVLYLFEHKFAKNDFKKYIFFGKISMSLGLILIVLDIYSIVVYGEFISDCFCDCSCGPSGFARLF